MAVFFPLLSTFWKLISFFFFTVAWFIEEWIVSDVLSGSRSGDVAPETVICETHRPNSRLAVLHNPVAQALSQEVVERMAKLKCGSRMRRLFEMERVALMSR
uniref:Secreted protein n=1 Tax=Ascaris lumbricoides TaxID=6252 RepID=A0A0M3HKZ1_ASCLU